MSFDYTYLICWPKASKIILAALMFKHCFKVLDFEGFIFSTCTLCCNMQVINLFQLKQLRDERVGKLGKK